LDVAEENYRIREDLKSEDWHYGYAHADQVGEERGRK
jgi:hypothetical protein